MHLTLRPKSNLVLIACWMAIATTALVIAHYRTVPIMTIGAVLGLFGGLLQRRAMRLSAHQLVAARTAVEIRSVFKATAPGRLYISIFWATAAALLVCALVLNRGDAGIAMLSGYSAQALMREIVTLKGTFELQSLEQKPTS